MDTTRANYFWLNVVLSYDISTQLVSVVFEHDISFLMGFALDIINL